MNDDTGNRRSTRTRPPRESRGSDGETLSGPAVLAVLAVLALVLTGGYFFAMKMIAVSKLDDCILGHRRNCAPPLVP